MRRTLAILMALALMAATLAGCTASSPSAGAQSNAPATPAPAASATPEAAAPYPLSSAPVTLKALAYKHNLTDEYTKNKVFQDLETLTNVKIEWEYTDTGADWDTQKPLLLASGSLPDIFLGGVLNESDITQNYPLFLQFDSYVDKLMPNVKFMFTDNPSMKKFATAPDGHIYGLPQQMPKRPVTFDMGMINQKWLTNLSLSMPTTTEEFRNVLKEFKDKDANGNGDPNDEIPLTFKAFNDLAGCMSLFGSFGVVESNNGSWLSVTNGKVEYIPTMSGFKNAIVYLHSLYKDRLIDAEAFTQDWSAFAAKCNPEAGHDTYLGCTFHWSIETAVGPAHAAEYAQLLPLKGPNGDQYWRYNPEMVKGSKYKLEIAASCKQPEIAVRWADTLYNQEISVQLFYGAFGVTMEKTSDGKYVVKDPPSGTGGEEWAWRYSMNDNAPGYSGDKFCENVTPPADVRNKLKADEAYRPFLKKEYFPLVSYTQQQANDLAVLLADIHNYAKERAAYWIVNGDIENDWDAFQNKMKEMGLERFVKIYQDAYDNYNK